MRQEMYDDSTTRRPSAMASSQIEPHVIVLSVLSHPDPHRVGERAALPELGLGRTVELCRSSPHFAQPGTSWDRPLDDPYISRRSWQLAPTDHGLELSRGSSPIDLVLDGVPLETKAPLPISALELGITLELSDRVALLLHRLPQAAFEAGEAAEANGEMVGASGGIVRVRSAIERVATLSVPVLLRGESGTGKELVARALHRQSQRASKPFVAVDLGVLSPALAASELFGHVKGAFTGANTARRGFFRAAEGGTLFLDEVGEATPEVQAMLLRVLETRQVVPVGSHTPLPVDVRLVAATDSDLEARTRRGDFKEPLLHRLAAYEVELPPLRERRDDLGRLLVHLARPVLRELGQEERLDHPCGDSPPFLPARLIARLARAPWTGNIRQLANVVRQLVIDSQGEAQLREGPRLQSLLGPTPAPRPPARSEPPPERPSPPEAPRRPSDLDDEEVEEAMRVCAFEPAAAARHLGIRRPSLYNLVRRHPRLRLAEDIPEAELRDALAENSDDVEATASQLEISRRALGRRIAQLSLG